MEVATVEDVEDGLLILDAQTSQLQMTVTYPPIGQNPLPVVGEDVQLVWIENEISFVSVRDMGGSIYFQGGDPTLGGPGTPESVFVWTPGTSEPVCGRPSTGEYLRAAVEFDGAVPVVLSEGQSETVMIAGRRLHAEVFFSFDVVPPAGSFDGLETIMEAILVAF